MSKHGALMVGFLLFGFVSLSSGPVMAKPSIEWQPEYLEARQEQGSQTRYSVTVSFNESAKDVVTRVVPALEQCLSVSPSMLGDVDKGDLVSLTVDVRVLEYDEPGEYAGVVQLRGGKNEKNLAKPLPVSLVITPLASGDLPPDPGEAGKQTLLGIDRDMDGIRDDIQRYVYLTYPGRPNVRNALLQITRGFQKALDPERQAGNARAIADEMGRGMECLGYIDRYEKSKMRGLLKAEILNTYERTLEFIEYDSELAGGVFSLSRLPRSERYKLCDFELTP